MNKQQLIEALYDELSKSPGEAYGDGWADALRLSIDIIRAQPEPTGMVVPLDAFVDLMTKMLPDDTTDAFDQGVRAARLVAIDDAKALAVPAGN